MENNSNERKFGPLFIAQIVMLIAAFAISAVGFVLIFSGNILRTVIYAFQCLGCIMIFVFGVLRIKASGAKVMKIILYGYALLEAVRCAILNTTGVGPVPAAIARFVLALLACSCILTAERIDEKEGWKAALMILALEIFLYIVFLAGFPGVLLGRLNRFMPIVGVLMAGSILLNLKQHQITE
ncbi:hypothetical protein [Butyrivibrio sp. MC2021]|uniref:hypothetical protein n=1 Tax=Butyrivibrio sp. MC2021 TaxID=1408306 RepID=UPI00047A8B5B|nr:hypothetical protein [Butyrivibrio sp. MC2021]